MNDTSDSYKQISYPSEPMGSCDGSTGSLFNTHVCHATACWRHMEPQGGSGAFCASWRLLQTFIPLIFTKFASKCSA